MSSFHLFISEAAEQDLKEIVAYIAGQLLEPQVALKQLGRLQAAIDSLKQMPERYALVKDEYLRSRGIRMTPVDNYLVFYIVDEKHATVHMVRVLYGKREWAKLL